jgi:hypothetical protein
MTRELRFVLGAAAKAYVAVAIAYCVYIWTVGPYAVPLLEVFGVFGTTVMVSVIHTQGTQ